MKVGSMNVSPRTMAEDDQEQLPRKLPRIWPLPPPEATEDFQVDCSDSGSVISEQEVPFPRRNLASDFKPAPELEDINDGDIAPSGPRETITQQEVKGGAEKKLTRMDKYWSGKKTYTADSTDHDLEWNNAIHFVSADQAVVPLAKIVQKQIKQTSGFKGEKWSKKVQSYQFLGVIGKDKLNQWKEMNDKKPN